MLAPATHAHTNVPKEIGAAYGLLPHHKTNQMCPKRLGQQTGFCHKVSNVIALVHLKHVKVTVESTFEFC
jgi:hypothetical protein